MNIVDYFINCLHTTMNPNSQTPCQRFTCKILLLRHIRVFGLQVYILKNNCIADKLSMRSYKGHASWIQRIDEGL